MNRIQLKKENTYLEQRMVSAETQLLNSCNEYFENTEACEKCFEKQKREKLSLCEPYQHFKRFLHTSGERNKEEYDHIVSHDSTPLTDFDIMHVLAERGGLDLLRLDSDKVKTRLGINLQEIAFDIPMELVAALKNQQIGFLCFAVNKEEYQKLIAKHRETGCIS